MMNTRLQNPSIEASTYKVTLMQINSAWQKQTLTESELEQLIPGLDDRRLLASTTALFDRCGFDWRVFCTKKTIKALRSAMARCRDINNAVLLEDVFLYIAHNRSDLRPQLKSCLDEAFHPEAPFDHSLLIGALRS